MSAPDSRPWFSLPLLGGLLAAVLFYAAAAGVWWNYDWLLENLFPNVAFARPQWLGALLILPPLWAFTWNSLAGLGAWRSFTALALRSLVLAAIVFALAEFQYVQRNERLTVLYLLDQSLSIPPERRQAMREYIAADVLAHRNRERGDRAGVIVFGRDARLDSPPVEADLAQVSSLEGIVDLETDATDLAAALRLAQATFPEDTARRVVVISDGNENRGDARTAAATLAGEGIGIDVVPVAIGSPAEVAIEKVTLPTEVRHGQPFEVRVILTNLTVPTAAHDGVVRGTLRLIRRAGEQESVTETPVELPPGKSVRAITQLLDQPQFYTYQAEFVPDRPGDDHLTQNNRATGFTQVRGKGRVLLIEDWENPGQFDYLVDRLRHAELEVVVQKSDQLFATLAELQTFDTVLLADVPRTSGGNERVTTFTDAQIDMLTVNTREFGAGLVMLGGPNSFGAGGWTGTKLEEAMPVNFQIENTKVKPIGALMLVIDSSGSMDGDKMAMARAAAIAAVGVLGPSDYVGVVAFDSEMKVVVPMSRVGDGQAARNRIRRLAAGGGTNMMPGMVEGYRQLEAVNASIKHMIVLTDGQTEGAGFPQLAARKRALNPGSITTTGVAVGVDAAVQLLSDIAAAGGGKNYSVRDARAIPRIFVREARRVAMPLVYEDERGFVPRVVAAHELLAGLDRDLPPLTGFMMTTVKENPLVEVAIASPVPAARHNTILATWSFGLGRTAVFTPDAGRRWAKAWPDWAGYDKLFTQLVRWSMRPVGGQDQFLVASDIVDGRARVTITALNAENEFLNHLDFQGAAVDPQLRAIPVAPKQVAPGRYVAEFEAPAAGNYFVTLRAGPGRAPLRFGLSVPYSREFLDRETNVPLLRELAGTAPQGGRPGQLAAIDWAAPRQAVAAATEPPGGAFRHDLRRAMSLWDAWPFVLVCGAVLFVADVFVRRVTVGFEWLLPILGTAARAVGGALQGVLPVAAVEWIFAWLPALNPAASTAPAEDRLSRLKSRKAALRADLDPRSDPTARRTFDLAPDAPSAPFAPPRSPDAPAPAAAAPLAAEAPPADADSYTSRLLRAKRQAGRGS